jgi:hypothetical protein
MIPNERQKKAVGQRVKYSLEVVIHDYGIFNDKGSILRVE